MGTPVGSLAEAQDLLDFCAKQHILPACEMIRMEQINAAFERMEQSDVRYCFVLDMSRWRAEEAFEKRPKYAKTITPERRESR